MRSGDLLGVLAAIKVVVEGAHLLPLVAVVVQGAGRAVEQRVVEGLALAHAVAPLVGQEVG